MSVQTPVGVGAETIEAVASARERLIELAAEVRDRPSVERTASGVDVRSYRSGSRLELYVEAELTSGNVVTWWVEAQWSREWTIESATLLNDDNGQSVLSEDAVRTARDASGFVEALDRTLDALVERARATELSRL